MCGLSGLEAQNLTKVFGGGGSPAYHDADIVITWQSRVKKFPAKPGTRWTGSFRDRPLPCCPDLRGPARIAVAIVCQDMRLEDAANLYFTGSGSDARRRHG